MNAETNIKHFQIGNTVITRNAATLLTEEDISNGITRHQSGDWGDVCTEDFEVNNNSINTGRKLLSSYHSVRGVKFWIITEADRQTTKVLLPEDY